MTDPVAAADAVVAAVDPGLSSPGVESRDVVLVTGPWLAGATSLIDALRERMPDDTFVEADELSVIEAPTAVVFVVSAVAPLTESDCALVDLAADNTDLVIGVVAKIDAHRNWRDVLAADRQALIAARRRATSMFRGLGRPLHPISVSRSSTSWSDGSASARRSRLCCVEIACARGKLG